MFAKDIPKSPIEYPNNRFPFNSRGGRGNVSSIIHQIMITNLENIGKLK